MADETWIGAALAARRLGISVKTLARVVAVAGVRTRELPGTVRRYNAADIDRIGAEAVKHNEPQAALAGQG